MSSCRLGIVLLGAIWLYSADVRRAAAFYRDAVGLPLLEGSTEDAPQFDAGNIRLAIHPAREGVVAGGAFYVFIVEDIDAAFAELSSRGVDFDAGITREEFGRIASFRDPDGHELYLWQIPGEHEPEYEHVRPHAWHYAKLRAALH